MVRTRAGRSVPRINQAVGFPLPPGPNNRDCGRPLPDSRDGAQEESRHRISDRHDRKRSRPRAQRLAWVAHLPHGPHATLPAGHTYAQGRGAVASVLTSHATVDQANAFQGSP